MILLRIKQLEAELLALRQLLTELSEQVNILASAQKIEPARRGRPPKDKE
jgi:hypothetical protein